MCLPLSTATLRRKRVHFPDGKTYVAAEALDVFMFSALDAFVIVFSYISIAKLLMIFDFSGYGSVSLCIGILQVRYFEVLALFPECHFAIRQ